MKFHLINQRYNLRPGYLIVYKKPLCVYGELGSGLFVALRDKFKKYSGCSFFLYPQKRASVDSSAIFGNIAIVHMISKMKSYGSKHGDLEAFIIGGGTKNSDFGKKNLDIARQILKLRNIPIISEDTGGLLGRKFVYDTTSGESITVKVSDINESCWYPYRGSYRRN